MVLLKKPDRVDLHALPILLVVPQKTDHSGRYQWQIVIVLKLHYFSENLREDILKFVRECQLQ